MHPQFRSHSIYVALAVLGSLVLASCNLPTATSDSAGDLDATEIEPAAAATDAPTAQPPTVEPTADATDEAAAGPTVTPEPGLRAVYTDDGNLWVVEAGSSPRQLTDGGNVSEVRISDDGQWIAYVIRNPNDGTALLSSIQFDGSEEQVLLNPGSFDILYPLGDFLHYTLSKYDFLPNSHTVLFNTRGVFDGPGIINNDDLLSIDAVSGQISLILLPGEGGDFTPSASGNQLAIVQPDSLSFVSTDGLAEQREGLAFIPVTTFSEFLYYPLPVWVDAEVVLAVPPRDPFFGEESGTVWTVDGEAEVLTRPQGDIYVPQQMLPIISPDGSRLAMFRSSGAPGGQSLIILDLVTGEETEYDAGAINWHGWSPDSNHFVYSKETGLELFLGELGAEPVPLGSGTDLRWVNAGEFLYFAGVPETWTLTLGDLSGASTPLVMTSDQFPVFDFAE